MSIECMLIIHGNHIIDFMISVQKKRKMELINFFLMHASYQTSLSIYSGLLLSIWKLCVEWIFFLLSLSYLLINLLVLIENSEKSNGLICFLLCVILVFFKIFCILNNKFWYAQNGWDKINPMVESSSICTCNAQNRRC